MSEIPKINDDTGESGASDGTGGALPNWDSILEKQATVSGPVAPIAEVQPMAEPEPTPIIDALEPPTSVSPSSLGLELPPEQKPDV